MNKKIDNILIGVLWLLGVTLGTCFWFNTRFGFNLFSNAHWQYLATQQATRTPVSFWFYFSLVASVFIGLFGLYLLIRPRKRRINLTPHPAPSPTQNKTPDTTPAPLGAPTTSAPILSRPPRLNIAPSNTFAAAPQTPVVATPATPTPAITNTTNAPAPTAAIDLSELREIFSSAHYVLKREPFINGKRMDILAIGTGEVLYLGASNISTSDMQSCANKLAHIFSDTLDGVDIYITAFVINPTDGASPSAPDILTFDSIENLGQYMREHPNPPLPADDDGNFDAYSDYISTVIEYIGKL
ncbi:MAG: hypothetical protein J6L70_01300 [Alphaproteobacteria bacterium]|nr:hypothetical protein [Alphaproteobacteria bacterium]